MSFSYCLSPLHYFVFTLKFVFNVIPYISQHFFIFSNFKENIYFISFSTCSLSHNYSIPFSLRNTCTCKLRPLCFIFVMHFISSSYRSNGITSCCLHFDFHSSLKRVHFRVTSVTIVVVGRSTTPPLPLPLLSPLSTQSLYSFSLCTFRAYLP